MHNFELQVVFDPDRLTTLGTTLRNLMGERNTVSSSALAATSAAALAARISTRM
jgi:hypothetical protein